MIQNLFRRALAGFKPQRREVDLRLVPLGFAALISIGAALLTLPWAHQPGKSLGTLDAFFLSTSATCVTGLVTVNVAETFNTFGHAVLLLLIQLGGLGILTAGILLVLAAGKRLSLVDEQTINATLGKLRQARPLDVFLYSCIFVVLIELAGAVALFTLMARTVPDVEPWHLMWESLFHSVSAFCNAGISIYPEGLARWRGRPGVLLIVALLVIAGGIGLMTLINLRYFYFWRRDSRRRGHLTLQTRLSLASAGVLLLLGTLVAWTFEINRTLAAAGLGDQLTWSFFHSAMARTAGFNVVDTGAMNPPTLLATLGLMFVGGAPGSMAGGIKTVTAVVILLTAWSALRRREELFIWGRRVPAKVSYIATMVVLLGALCVMTGVGLLMFTEDQQAASEAPHGWLGVVFEAVSAFGTVGLSTGVTPLLTGPGKVIIIVLMFVGRIGPLMLAVFLTRPPTPRAVRPPVEEVSLG